MKKTLKTNLCKKDPFLCLNKNIHVLCEEIMMQS